MASTLNDNKYTYLRNNSADENSKGAPTWRTLCIMHIGLSAIHRYIYIGADDPTISWHLNLDVSHPVN